MAHQSSNYLLELPLKDADLLVANDAVAIQEWIAGEASFWDWLSEPNPKKIGLQADGRNKLRASLRDARAAAASGDLAVGSEALNKVKEHLQTYANLGLSSKTPRAKYFQQLRTQVGEIVAGAAVADFLGSAWHAEAQIPPDVRRLVHVGRIASALFDLGIGNDVSNAVSTAAAEITNGFREALQAGQMENRLALSTTEAALEQLQSNQSELTQNIEREWNEFKDRSEKAASGAVTDLRNTEAAYKEQMKLRSAVSYWSKKGKEHRDKAAAQRWVLMAFAVAAMAIVSTVIYYVFHEAVGVAKELNEKASTPLLLLGGFALLVASAVLWIGRLLVRVYFDERQRSQDAYERATMAETYAALTHENLVSEAERVIVLSSLFRPGSDGGSRDDGAPESLQFAALAKLLDQKQAGKT